MTNYVACIDGTSDAFYNLFDVHTGSLCGHASDALNPALQTSFYNFLSAG